MSDRRAAPLADPRADPAPAVPAPPDEILRDGRFAGVDPEKLAVEFGTPLYVYDLDVVSRRVAMVRDSLPDRFDVAYACKANPALGVVAHLAWLGLGADVASGGELETALRAGMRRGRIVLTGPGKPDELLRRAVRLGVRAVTIESPSEFERLERLAALEGRRVPVLLRLAAGEVTPAGQRRSGDGGGGPGKFGMSADDVLAVAQRAVRSSHVDLLGLHAFGASNVLDAEALADHVAGTVERARRVAAEAGFRLRLVDVGGGLGIPYADGEAPLDLGRLGARLRALAAAWLRDPLLAKVRVLLEPGRFLVGTAGAYLTRVVDVKTLDGRHVAIVDGGIHHLLRPALVGREHRVLHLQPNGRATKGADRRLPVTIAGPLCTGLDVFSPAAEMCPPSAGDLLALLDAGAYGYTESMLGFLSHPAPAEVAVRHGEPRLLRPRVDPLEALARQRMPLW